MKIPGENSMTTKETSTRLRWIPLFIVVDIAPGVISRIQSGAKKSYLKKYWGIILFVRNLLAFCGNSRWPSLKLKTTILPLNSFGDKSALKNVALSTYKFYKLQRCRWLCVDDPENGQECGICQELHPERMIPLNSELKLFCGRYGSSNDQFEVNNPGSSIARSSILPILSSGRVNTSWRAQ